MAHPTLLAVSHGTSDADGARSIAAMVAQVAERLPEVAVRTAFVDVQAPDVTEAVPAIAGPVVIVPLLLSNGFHVGHDLHGIAKTRHDVVVADPLGPDARLAEVLAQRLPPGDSPVILAVAGSRDPRSVIDAEGMAALLRAQIARPVELAYLAARSPRLDAAVAQHPDATVATYLLARGFFFDLAQRQASGRSISLPLLDDGPTPGALVDLVVARYFEGVAQLIGSASATLQLHNVTL